jgi:hypothetical protein
MHLGDAEPGKFFSGKSVYSAKLSEITLPPGIYSLMILVVPESEKLASGYIEIPMIRIV